MENPNLTRQEWMSEKIRTFFALGLYASAFLAFLGTLLILAYQGLGYLNHGEWIKYNIESFLQQFAWDWYLKYLDWLVSPSDRWEMLTQLGKGVLEIPVTLITFIFGVMGWGLAAAVDPKDRFWRT